MHFDRRIALVSLTALVAGGIALWGGCSGDQQVAQGQGVCGNNIVEAGEECDDGNFVDDDSCSNVCTIAGGCGNAEVEGDEECDDGNSVNDDGCTNQCIKTNKNCGNGEVDEADNEECDDANDVNDDGCTNVCTLPFCGDGIVQAGEDCDDGNNEVNDNCPPTCLEGPPPCEGQQIFAGVVSNDQSPGQPGTGIGAVWSYGGQLGIQAGNEMCAAIGADHVCTYKEVIDADAAGELTPAKGVVDAMTFWVHRVDETVPQVIGGGMSPPGAGGRCNDWTYPTNHISDGEYGIVGNYPDDNGPGGGTLVNNITYYFDDDTVYTGDLNNPHAGSGPGFAGACGPDPGGPQRALLCCYASCE